MLNQNYIPEINTGYCLILFANVLLAFCIYTSEGYYSWIFFSFNIYVCFLNQGNLRLIKMSKGVFPFLLKRFCVRLVLFLSWTFCRIHQRSHLRIMMFCLGNLFLIVGKFIFNFLFCDNFRSTEWLQKIVHRVPIYPSPSLSWG